MRAPLVERRMLCVIDRNEDRAINVMLAL